MNNGSPEFWIKFHKGAIFVFLLEWGLASFFGWVNSDSFISHVSMQALVYAGLIAWQAARGEKAAKDG